MAEENANYTYDVASLCKKHHFPHRWEARVRLFAVQLILLCPRALAVIIWPHTKCLLRLLPISLPSQIHTEALQQTGHITPHVARNSLCYPPFRCRLVLSQFPVTLHSVLPPTTFGLE